MTLADSSDVPVEPIKSVNDKRKYRSIKLTNGLTALLITDQDSDDVEDEKEETVSDDGEEESEDGESGDDADGEDSDMSVDEGDDENEGSKKPAKDSPSEKLSAAALCIGQGSFSEPDDIPGLAHFLEHMVFMGSEKYPDENDFDMFIRKYGGSDNAFTDCERTVFYFDIQRQQFYDGLDRFAQFFISPLMKQDSVDRETKAVDSEFDMSTASDNAKKQQLMGTTAAPGHPMGKFMWGNTKSLKEDPAANNIDIYERLQTFHKNMYSSHYMTLAVQSRHSLDTLEKWVREIFAPVTHNGKDKPSFANLESPFNNDRFYKMYKWVPIKNVHQIEVTWVLPCQLQYYRTKPLHYIGWLTGHEGKGSILSYLRKKLWALKLDSGNGETGFEHNTTMASFSINVTLTDEGLDHYQEVLSVLFEYIQMLRNEGPCERIWSEIKTIEDNSFRWQEQREPMDYVEKLCENMQLFPPEHYLTGEDLLMDYDSKVIAECLNCLVPSKANIMLVSKRFEESGECTEKEKWYQTPYNAVNIPDDWISQWADIQPRPEFHLPAANEYIASDFSLKEVEEKLNTEYPTAIVDTPQGKLWYKKDSKFKVPKAYIHVHLISPVVNKTALDAVLLDLFILILEQNLAEVAYAADVAELSYSFKPTDIGLVVKVSGFNHKLPKLFETIIDYLSGFKVDQDVFGAVKETLTRTYFNQMIKPSKLNREVRIEILMQSYWTVVSRRQMIDDVTLPMLLGWVEQFKSRLMVETYFHGNLLPQECKDMYGYVLEKVKCRVLPGYALADRRVVELPTKDSYVRVKTFNEGDCNTGITNYYQTGPGTLHMAVVNELLNMQMEEPCFDILRTREQLGYGVFSYHRDTCGILGLSVTVQSQTSTASMSELNDHIENFVKEFGKMVADTTQELFDTLIDTLVKLKRCEDSNMGEEVDRHWNQILTQLYFFDRIPKEITEIGTLKLDEYKAWYKTVMMANDNRRKLSVQISAYDKTPNEESGDKDTQKFKDKPTSVTSSGDTSSVISKEWTLSYESVSDILSQSGGRAIGIDDIQKYKDNLNILPVSRIVSQEKS
ncbi:unnamed protein product [Owenia fusiformis]|uniref:Uncharacterized protein n=1 Tax=Owenia fusiformis TaxID=6347 RepID=A0A8J1XZK0_OWEFU|nr:unnamed protein product [Owenia fusiformis]